MSVFYVENIPDKFKELGELTYLAQGSVSTVYRITGKDRDYALKIIPCGTSVGKFEAARKEIMIMERLSDCDRVIKLLDSMVTEDDNGKTVYLLEDYAVLLPEHMQVNQISVFDILDIALAVLDAMIACEQRGIIHLDIQPNNVFIGKNGRAVLGDFSSSLLLEELLENKQPRGTLAYMAPEVYRGQECSAQSDIYSLGILLYFMLNNRRIPFVEDINEERAIYIRLTGAEFPVLEHLDDYFRYEIEPIIDKACAFNRCDRYEEIEHFRYDLYRLRDKMHCQMEELQLRMKAIEELEYTCASFGDGGPTYSSYRDSFNVCSSHQPRFQQSDWSWSEDNSGISVIPRDYDADPFATSVPISPAIGKGYLNRTQDALENSFPLPSIPLTATTCTTCGKEAGDGNFCPNCGAKIIRDNPGLKISKVDFSAIAPCAVKKGEYSLINVIMYEEEFRRIVDEIIAQSDGAVQEEKSGIVKVAEGAKIKMILSSPDMKIEDDTEERQWNGDYLKFCFSALIPKDFAKTQILFVVTVYINNVIATRLMFKAKITDNVKQELEIFREDIMSAFVSFADQDINRALRVIQGIQAIRSDMDIRLSSRDFRSRQDYERAARKEIDYRDVFYLCWSEFSQESKQVDFEWKYAYEKKGLTGMELIPLELLANCPLPSELEEKHINDKIFIYDIPDEKLYIRKNVYLNRTEHAVYVNEQKKELGKYEYRLLEYLANNLGRYESVENIGNYTWGCNEFQFVDNKSVTRLISQINSKISDACKIENKRNVGYYIAKETLIFDTDDTDLREEIW